MKPGPYSILLSKYRDGRHSLRFLLDDTFFSQYDPEAPTGNHVEVLLTMQKSDRLVDLKLHFTGAISTPCDRCMELYPQAIDTERRLIYTPNREEDARSDVDELLPLDPQNPVIHLEQELYDFACLALPHRRVPPHCPSDACPQPVLAYLKEEDSTRAAGAGAPATEPPSRVDPRWEKLRALLKPEEQEKKYGS